MPSLGADMDEGTVIEWLVKPGDTVHKGDPVAVVDTAKAAVEVETFTGGTIQQILVPIGQRVQVGTPLATIDSGVSSAMHLTEPADVQLEGQQSRSEAAQSEQSPAEPVRSLPEPLLAQATRAAAQAQSEPPRAEPAAQVLEAADGRMKASPYARKLARSLGLDLTAVPATGQHGLITSGDVRRYADRLGTVPAGEPAPATTPPSMAPPAEAPPPVAAEPAPRHVVQQAAQREAIARLMTRSKQEIPHYYLTTTVDLGAAIDWLAQQNRSLPVADRLVPTALLLKATALSAQQHPELNGYWTDGAFQPAAQVHLGVAISLRGGGLVAPAIHDAAGLPVRELMAGLRDLVARARAGRLRRTELTDATITVTNLGDQGVESVYGVIYPPQVALVGVGRVVRRPWAVDGLLGVRPCATLTLAADHRATDGFTGGRFLATIDRLLQKPEEL
ncbi:pyruvate dehydrogenase E2 component (dihydrolipoamide acetyltransferase) [Kribbella orskensis]|uniref:Dihydrolipoamide acetyltransferase component of pyruvate dehydrogenase complex n=2 Tax=Kribbellaceae TaxID=2726069 RepID=A0ABY2B6Y1_9ACTN|nr:pyruvate dehydrogenase E2 component (dihydrolipoamide acetyltransferase) [Kribbella sp. VKM Ac-2500]TCO09942.1 pyruvate dehydrogenase E2 component (dihydrolipoamide acetyltransferase) [Kribbella orskensis]